MNRRTILLADSDVSARAELAGALREADAEVTEVSDGDEFLHAASAGQPSVGVVDWHLYASPALQQGLGDGFETPLVVLGADAESAVEAARSGAQGFVLKPADPRQLLATAEVAIARSEQCGALRRTCGQLETALRQGRETSIAIGILMTRRGVDERAAFEQLRQYARRHRRKLVDVSAELVQDIGAVNRLCTDTGSQPAD